VKHLFLFGTLCDPELRSIVVGHETEGRPARLKDYVVERAEAGDWPILVARAGATVEGVLVTLDDKAADRADFYEAAFAYTPEPCLLETAEEGRVEALLYRAPGGRGSGTAWLLDDWQRLHGPLTRTAAQEAMSLYGKVDAKTLCRRMPTIRVRAAATVRARATPAPSTVRSPRHRDSVEILNHRQPYHHFFAVGQTDLRHPTFAGGMSAPMERAGLHAADAVSVLPFDPSRRRVLLVEQFRYGAWLRGDPYPWQLEPPAGRVDPGETPETAVRREALEEAGISIGKLFRIAGYYPAPGSITEFVDSYVGLADLPDTAEGLGGLPQEQEDIRIHILPFDDAMNLIETGEASTGPLVLSLLWLDRALRRGELR